MLCRGPPRDVRAMTRPDFPRTLAEFQGRFASEEDCRRYLVACRWPDGFRCPRCGEPDAYGLAGRELLQCRACRHQTSVTAGTGPPPTHVPPPLWVAAACLVTPHPPRVSAGPRPPPAGPAPDAPPPPALVRGGVPGPPPHAGLLGGPAPAAVRPRPVRDRVDDAARAAPGDGPPGAGPPLGRGRGRRGRRTWAASRRGAAAGGGATAARRSSAARAGGAAAGPGAARPPAFGGPPRAPRGPS